MTKKHRNPITLKIPIKGSAVTILTVALLVALGYEGYSQWNNMAYANLNKGLNLVYTNETTKAIQADPQPSLYHTIERSYDFLLDPTLKHIQQKRYTTFKSQYKKTRALNRQLTKLSNYNETQLQAVLLKAKAINNESLKSKALSETNTEITNIQFDNQAVSTIAGIGKLSNPSYDQVALANATAATIISTKIRKQQATALALIKKKYGSSQQTLSKQEKSSNQAAINNAKKQASAGQSYTPATVTVNLLSAKMSKIYNAGSAGNYKTVIGVDESTNLITVYTGSPNAGYTPQASYSLVQGSHTINQGVYKADSFYSNQGTLVQGLTISATNPWILPNNETVQTGSNDAYALAIHLQGSGSNQGNEFLMLSADPSDTASNDTDDSSSSSEDDTSQIPGQGYLISSNLSDVLNVLSDNSGIPIVVL